MKSQIPVYTEKAECRDCYKCVRNCPVKAIEVVNHSASVMAEQCISCGRCLRVCPTHAKKYRTDIEEVSNLLKSKKVVASIAPSIFSDFSNIETSKIVGAIKALGFEYVSETALGAELVSQFVDEELKKKIGIQISSACPVVVDYIVKYYPELSETIVECVSPAQAHAKYLKEKLGDDIAVVFIGPCVAKKLEAKNCPELDAVITFEELQKMLQSNNISFEKAAEEDLFPQNSSIGRMYPLDGGMIKTLSHNDEINAMSFSGMEAVDLALNGLQNKTKSERPVFLELLACEGGCINGPANTSKKSMVEKGMEILEFSKAKCEVLSCSSSLSAEFAPAPLNRKQFKEEDIEEALSRIGKKDKANELNCGGCGYSTCRNFACAMLEGKAESSMCVSYMRQLAAKKANALLKSMPSGVVIVDEGLTIVDSNKKFADILGDDTALAYEAKGSLEGADFKRIFPQYNYFERAMHFGESSQKRIRYKGSVLLLSVFPIEDGKLAGAIFQDVTEPSIQREEIIKHTQDVIKKNLNTVQQIAYLLGENAAETEVILKSIIDSYKVNE